MMKASLTILVVFVVAVSGDWKWGRRRHRPTITPDCTLPADPGRCWFRKRLFIRYFFNEETGTCEVFRYRGCKGNSNRFRSLQSCQDECGDENNGDEGDGDNMDGGGDGDNMGGGGDGDNMGGGGDGDNMGSGGDGDNMGGEEPQVQTFGLCAWLISQWCEATI